MSFNPSEWIFRCPFNHQPLFSESYVAVFYNENIYFPSYNNNLYLCSGSVSALSRCAAQRRPLAGLRPRPQTEVLILASIAAIWSCVQCHCQCVHSLSSIPLDYPGQAPLPNWPTKFSKPLSLAWLEYITPLFVCCMPCSWLCSLLISHCLCPRSRLFGWVVKTIFPLCSEFGALSVLLFPVLKIAQPLHNPSSLISLIFLINWWSVSPFRANFIVSAVPSCSFLCLTRSS